MARKEIAATIDAAKVAAQVITDYGTNSPEAAGSLVAALDARDRAYEAGATRADIERAAR